MTKIDILYEGELHNLITHEQTGQTIHTDAPKDNKGKGETFSPTDLFAASLGSCITTVIGIYAARKGLDLRGMRATVEKTMSTDAPRRIIRLVVDLWIPLDLPQEEREKIQAIAHTCPVHNSLSPELEVVIQYFFGGRLS